MRSSPSARSVACWLWSGSRSSTVLRARWSALLTAATVVSSDLGDLRGREAEHLAQDQHRALVRRQVLERRDERQLDALALLVGRTGRGEPVREARRPDRARPRPTRRSGSPGESCGRGGRAEVDRQRALRPPRELVQARVRRDLVEPRAQRAALREARQGAPGPQQRLLERVLGVVDRAEHPVAVGVQLRATRLHEAAVGILVARASRLDQLALLQGHGRGSDEFCAFRRSVHAET